MLITRNMQWWLTARDGSGTTGLMRGTFRPGTTVAAGLAGLSAIRSLIEPLSGCVFVRQSVSISASYRPKPLPSGETPVNQVGALFFTCDDPNQFFLARVPGVPATMTRTTGCGAGIVLDETLSPVADVISALVDGIFTNPFNHGLNSYISGYLRTEI